MNIATPKTTEQREHRRIFRSTGHLRFLGYPPIRVRTFDLCTTGACIIAPLNLPPKTLCALRITLPTAPAGSSPLELPVRVTQTFFCGSEDGFKIGLEFGKLSEEIQLQLKRYLKS